MNSRGIGILSTIIFHLALVLLLWATGFSTPLPLPAEEGVMINFGDGPDGSGPTEPALQPRTAPRQQAPRPADTPTPLTQDHEEAPALPVPDRKPAPKPTTKPQPQAQPTTTPEQPSEAQPEPTPEPPKQTVNQRAMFPGQKANGSSTSGEGDTGRPGNQGSPEGSPDSGSRTGGASGGGGTGSGISHILDGFDATNLLKPQAPAANAIVVVRVEVDASGRVVSAIGGQKGSTILVGPVVTACEEAAKRSTFKRKAGNTDTRAIGEITYRFRTN